MHSELVRSYKELSAFLMKLEIPFDGKTAWHVSVKKYARPRSNNQNRLYWSWLRVLAAESESGHTEEEFHAYFKMRFLALKECEVFGQQFVTPVSTTGLNTAEMTEYLNKVHLFAAENGVSLPYPGDQYYDEMIAKYGGRE